MPSRPAPFAFFEWMIAWRYLRARRSEGGVSVMTWISLIGIALAVFALVATLAVRSGFRYEFVRTILGANAHATIYASARVTVDGRVERGIGDYRAVADRLAALPGVAHAAAVVRGQVLATAHGRNAGVVVLGMEAGDFASVPLIRTPEVSAGDIARFPDGVAIGSGVARELGIGVGDRIRLISPDGVRTAFGVSPRVKSYEVVYVFGVGRYDIDSTRIYMPLAEAQAYFNREGRADEIQVMLDDPDRVEEMVPKLLSAAGERGIVWTWRDASGAFLQALRMEDNVMFVLLSILVLIASMNIVSGLIMLVKNKGRDIGILRTIGLTEGAVMRVFFICGASVGLAGTVLGVVLGCLFAIYIDPIFAFVDGLAGGGVWDPSVRYLSRLPARLEVADVLSAAGLSLALSFGITLIPARRAARLNPVEALRYE